MDRRAFLRVAVRGRERVLELSCERLYMRWSDARAGVGVAAPTSGHGEWGGEPPLEVALPTVADLLAELARELAAVEVLRVTGREWLAQPDFRRDVEARIEAFRRRGGRVE
jgi:hypothetical protein